MVWSFLLHPLVTHAKTSERRLVASAVRTPSVKTTRSDRPVEASPFIIMILLAQPAPVAHALDTSLDLVGVWCLPSCADPPQTLLAAHELWLGSRRRRPWPRCFAHRRGPVQRRRQAPFGHPRARRLGPLVFFPLCLMWINSGRLIARCMSRQRRIKWIVSLTPGLGPRGWSSTRRPSKELFPHPPGLGPRGFA